MGWTPKPSTEPRAVDLSKMAESTKAKYVFGEKIAFPKPPRKATREPKGGNPTGGPMKKHWTKEMCIESALQFETKTDWAVHERTAHNAAKAYGPIFFFDCTKHMLLKNNIIRL